jgi:hypothetical protein
MMNETEKLEVAEKEIAEWKAKFDMLNSHCIEREHYIKMLEQTIVRMAIRGMENSDI